MSPYGPEKAPPFAHYHGIRIVDIELPEVFEPFLQGLFGDVVGPIFEEDIDQVRVVTEKCIRIVLAEHLANRGSDRH